MDNNAPQSVLSGVVYAVIASIFVAIGSIDLSRQRGRLYAFFSLLGGLCTVSALTATGAIPLAVVWPTLWTIVGVTVSTILRLVVRSS